MVRLELVEWDSGLPSAIEAGAATSFASLTPSEELERWSVQRGEMQITEAGSLRVRSRGDDPNRPVRLQRDDLSIDLTPVERIRITGTLQAPSAMRLTLAVEGEGERRSVLFDESFADAGAFEFLASTQLRGTLVALTLQAPTGARIEGLEFESEPLSPGYSPRVVDGRARDAGLRSLLRRAKSLTETRYQERRAIPARSDVWQVAEYTAGGAAELSGAIALPDESRLHVPAVTFEIWAREAQGSTPPEGARMLLSKELSTDTDSDLWVPYRTELPGLDDEAWELFFVTRSEASQGRVDGLWAEPVLVRGEAQALPDLVLITGDTLRRDHVGAIRAALGLEPLAGLETPFLDSLAESGTNYVDALATCNATSPSHASILTGHYVRDHRVEKNDRTLSEGALTLAELLRERYFCVSSVTAGHLNSSVSGLGQGFDVTFGAPPLGGASASSVGLDGRDQLPTAYDDAMATREAPFANARLERFLDGADGLPLFVWLHYFDPHTPYRVTAEVADLLPKSATDGLNLLDEMSRQLAEHLGDGSTTEQERARLLQQRPELRLGGTRSVEWMHRLYAAGISELDRDLARLFERFDERSSDRVVVFTADHGESLGERDVWFGHNGTYTNTLNVPLILSGPGLPEGVVSDAPVSTIDLLPTLAELGGVQTPPDLPGKSLLGPGPDADRRRWFQHSSDIETGYREGDRHVVLVTRDHRRGVNPQWRRAGTIEVLVDDRLAVEDTERDAAALEQIERWRSSPVLDLEAIEAELSEAARAELRALGYTDD